MISIAYGSNGYRLEAYATLSRRARHDEAAESRMISGHRSTLRKVM
jgi:hypothetical protein